MTGFPLPEQSKNDKRYLSCRFDIRKTQMRRRSTCTRTSSIDHALNSQTSQLPLERSQEPILSRHRIKTLYRPNCKWQSMRIFIMGLIAL